MKIGVGIDHFQNSDTGITPAYTEIREMALAAEAGVAHLILQPTPSGLPALERVTAAVRHYREGPDA